MPFRTPAFHDTPAPTNYMYSVKNKPTDKDKTKIKKLYGSLDFQSAVCSLLYLALGAQPDILWIVTKLAKANLAPGLKDFHALLWCFGYLRKYQSWGIKIYSNAQESPVSQILKQIDVCPTDIIVFSDSSWQDCPDTGHSTCG